MNKQSIEWKIKCTVCGGYESVRRSGASKGRVKFFCAECCSELHKFVKVVSKGTRRVTVVAWSVTAEGETLFISQTECVECIEPSI